MTKETKDAAETTSAPETGAGATHKKVDALPLKEKAIFVVVRQTETRTIWETITGRTADEVRAYANELSLQHKTIVGVFGPQVAAYEPPAEVKAVEVELKF